MDRHRKYVMHMSGDKPLVSVVMGVYYRREDLNLLRRAMDSILNQNYDALEFLICDDGSTLEASACLDSYANLDQRVRLIRGVKDTSLPAKLNACLSKAEGMYIARMDDDDFSYKDRLNKQVTFLQAHPEISFVGSDVNLITNGRLIGTKRFPEYPCVRDFYMTQPFIHPTLLFRREALEWVGGYSEKRHCDHCEDYDLLLRLYAAGLRGANMQQVLFDYTAPDAKGNRTMRHRWHECVTRYRCFRELDMLPGALLYVIKPIVVGILPVWLLGNIKKKGIDRTEGFL